MYIVFYKTSVKFLTGLLNWTLSFFIRTSKLRFFVLMGSCHSLIFRRSTGSLYGCLAGWTIDLRIEQWCRSLNYIKNNFSRSVYWYITCLFSLNLEEMLNECLGQCFCYIVFFCDSCSIIRQLASTKLQKPCY